MLDFLIDLDKEVLLLCNGTHTAWLDNFFWIVTARYYNVFVALPLLTIIGLHIYKLRGGAVVEALLVIVALVVAVLIADQVASSILKPAFRRLRPSHDPTLSVILVNNYHGGRYGFVSSHAANTFAAAVLLLNIFRNRYFSVAILGWAVLVSFSRIYLGVHFPGDILCGALLGMTVGWGVYWLYQSARRKLCTLKVLPQMQNPYCRADYARCYAVYILLLFVAVGVVSILV